MSDADSPRLLRMERGSPDVLEMAALIAVLFARGLGPRGEPDGEVPGRRMVARWRRPERAPGFEGPRRWGSGIRG